MASSCPPFLLRREIRLGAIVLAVYVGSVIRTLTFPSPYVSHSLTSSADRSIESDRILNRSALPLQMVYLVSVCAAINVLTLSMLLLLGVTRIRHIYVIILWMGICFNDITSLLYGWAMIRTITASILLGWETWYVTYDVNNILFSKWQHQLSLNFWMTLLLSTVSVWNMVHRIYDLFMLPRFVSRVESVIGRISTYHDIHGETPRNRNNCINFGHCTDL
jgi:hypothetical protein